MTEILNRRASSAYRWAHCALSHRPEKDEITVNPVAGLPARIGSAVHKMMEDYITTGDHGDEDSYAELFECVGSEGDLRFLAAVGRKFWETYHGFFPDPTCERRLAREITRKHGLLELSGTPDVDSQFNDGERGEIAVWVDYKSGRMTEEKPYLDQMKVYAWLLMRHYNVQHATCFIVWLREEKDQQLSVIDWTYDEIDDWLTPILEAQFTDAVFHPGPQCAYCERSTSCPGLAAQDRHALTVFGAGGAAEIVLAALAAGQVPPGKTMAAMLEQGARVKKLNELLRDATKRCVAANGPILLPGGKAIQVKERAGATIIDPARSWPVLRAAIPEPSEPDEPDPLLGTITVGKTKVEAAIKAAVEKGQGAKAVRAAFAELDAAGAISHAAPIQMLTVAPYTPPVAELTTQEDTP